MLKIGEPSQGRIADLEASATEATLAVVKEKQERQESGTFLIKAASMSGFGKAHIKTSYT